MSKTRLLSPFCVLSCNQSSSLFSGLLCRFRYSPVERFFYKFDGIDCRPKLGTKLLDRFFHRRRHVSPPVNRLTHRFFDGSQHFLYCNFTVGSRHSAVTSFSADQPLSTAYGKTAALLDYPGNISARDVFEVHDVVDLTVGPLCPFNSHCTGTSAGAPLSLIKNTRNFAGLVPLAFRSTT